MVLIYCVCGCGEEIIIKPWHKYDGIPKYITGHHVRGKPSPMKGIPKSEEFIEKCKRRRHT